MDAAVKALMTSDVQAAIARVVGVEPEHLKALGGFESFVFETVIDGTSRIVKATWHERRAPEQIGAELHFVRFLADANAPVCRGLPLVGGEDVVSVPAAQGAFHVYAFEKAPGTLLPERALTDEQAEQCGALVGMLHRLSCEYPGPPAPLSRPISISRRSHASLSARRAS